MNVPTLGNTPQLRAVADFRRNAAMLPDNEREEVYKEADYHGLSAASCGSGPRKLEELDCAIRLEPTPRPKG